MTLATIAPTARAVADEAKRGDEPSAQSWSKRHTCALQHCTAMSHGQPKLKQDSEIALAQNFDRFGTILALIGTAPRNTNLDVLP